MAAVEYSRATEADIAELAAHMRDGDRAEAMVGGIDIEAGIRAGCTMSGGGIAGRVNGKLLGIFGTLECEGGYTGVWLLTTKEVEKHKLTFWRATVDGIKILRKSYASILTVVDERYTRAMRWVERLGFKPGEQKMVGGLPHRVYTLEGT